MNPQLLEILPINELRLLQSSASLLFNLGAGLSQKDQDWLCNHLEDFIKFIGTEDGGELMSYVIEVCKEKTAKRNA